MNLDLNEITFIIVSYKAKQVIYNCINSLPKFSKKIVIENSYDQDLKKELETKYDNIEVVLNKNQGMGASNNIGIRKANTKFVFVLNPDVVFKENTLFNLVSTVKNIDDFSILTPIILRKLIAIFNLGLSFLFNSPKFLNVDIPLAFDATIKIIKNSSIAELLSDGGQLIPIIFFELLTTISAIFSPL